MTDLTIIVRSGKSSLAIVINKVEQFIDNSIVIGAAIEEFVKLIEEDN